MIHTAYYDAPYGRYVMAAEDGALTGVWLEGQKHFPSDLPAPSGGESEIFTRTRRWLDAYFAGQRPELSALPIAPKGSDFAQSVWQLLLAIPYGQTTTYGQLAAQLAEQRGLPQLSAQAVGGAVGHNPISLIIPCHRVLGAKNQLTGYAGGLDVKTFLLKLEGVL
ncbi:MAG: methylated-DNA--[protein]-cysteine S-methyltransferase [Candidatus Limivicinus sp.]